MSATATVIYPNEDSGAKFDLDYYLSTHMPLVAKEWGKYGLKEWTVTQFEKGMDGGAPPYRIKAILHWESADSIAKAVSSEEAKTVFGDVPNFTTISPVFAAGTIVGSAKA